VTTNFELPDFPAGHLGIVSIMKCSNGDVRLVWDVGSKVGGEYSSMKVCVEIANGGLTEVWYEEHVRSLAQSILYYTRGGEPKADERCRCRHRFYMLFDRGDSEHVKGKH
jgi:hypothetical protein